MKAATTNNSPGGALQVKFSQFYKTTLMLVHAEWQGLAFLNKNSKKKKLVASEMI